MYLAVLGGVAVTPSQYEISGAPAEAAADNAQGGLPVELLSMLVRRRRTALQFTVVGAFLGIALALLPRNQFESSAELMPPDQAGSSFLAAALGAHGGEMAGSALPSLLGIKTSGALFIGILQSRSAADDLIAKFNLQQEYKTPTLEKTRRRLLGRSEFVEEKKTGIITVRVRDTSREQARKMCQEYIDVLDRLTAQVSTSAARREREFLERRLVLAGDELSRSEQDFSRFATANKAVDIPEETKETVVAAANLQGQLAAAEAELNALRQLYAQDNARVRATEGRVDVLRSKLKQLEGTSAQANAFAADELMTPSFQQLPGVGVTYADLFRKVKMQEALYSALANEYELARVQEAREIPTVRVLDPPNLPETEAAPKRAVMAAGFTFLALLSGCTWAFVQERWSELDPSDARRKLARTIAIEMHRDYRKLRSMLTPRGRVSAP